MISSKKKQHGQFPTEAAPKIGSFSPIILERPYEKLRRFAVCPFVSWLELQHCRQPCRLWDYPHAVPQGCHSRSFQPAKSRRSIQSGFCSFPFCTLFGPGSEAPSGALYETERKLCWVKLFSSKRLSWSLFHQSGTRYLIKNCLYLSVYTWFVLYRTSPGSIHFFIIWTIFSAGFLL